MRRRYCAAQPFGAFLDDVRANADLWRAITRRAAVPEELVARVRALEGRWHLLVLAEDWCGDAVNTLPVLARLAELAGNVDLRVLSRDANADLMDAHRSPAGARAIPVVMVLDERFIERAWWGSRPRELQNWVSSTGATSPKEERYLAVRRWYVQDRGVSAMREIVDLLDRAAGRAQAA